VVEKIHKVLGIRPATLPEHDLIGLIEALCDTALMFDREAQAAPDANQETNQVAASPSTSPPSTHQAPSAQPNDTA
jgi:hypothetical protein